MLSVLSMSLQKVLDLDVHINHKHLSNTGSHIGRSQCLKVPLLHSSVPDEARPELIM